MRRVACRPAERAAKPVRCWAWHSAKCSTEKCGAGAAASLSGQKTCAQLPWRSRSTTPGRMSPTTSVSTLLGATWGLARRQAGLLTLRGAHEVGPRRRTDGSRLLEQARGKPPNGTLTLGELATPPNGTLCPAQPVDANPADLTLSSAEQRHGRRTVGPSRSAVFGLSLEQGLLPAEHEFQAPDQCSMPPKPALKRPTGL